MKELSLLYETLHEDFCHRIVTFPASFILRIVAYRSLKKNSVNFIKIVKERETYINTLYFGNL